MQRLASVRGIGACCFVASEAGMWGSALTLNASRPPDACFTFSTLEHWDALAVHWHLHHSISYPLLYRPSDTPDYDL